MTGNLRPRSPGIAIKPGSKAKLPADSAGQDDGLKRIQQDEENEKNAGNGRKNHHGTMVMLRPEMVADLARRDRRHIFILAPRNRISFLRGHFSVGQARASPEDETI